MAHLLSIPENVIIQQLFSWLDHNDLLRLRRVSKKTKALADMYLWTPKPGHQGNWELEINSSNEYQTLEAFIKFGLPPPSRLYISNEAEKGPSEQGSFFEDDNLEEFIKRYGKYVTKLSLDQLFIPLTSTKEIDFYESLVNLEELCCYTMITFGGAAQFEEKTKRAEGSFLIRPTWSKKLKIFKLDETDCMDSMWNFINGVSSNLKELLHPFQRIGEEDFTPTNFAPVQQLIDRRGGMNSQSKLLYNWRYLPQIQEEPLELLHLYASCRDNGVMIKKLDANHLDCLLLNEDVMDGNYQRNQFVGSIIESLDGVNDAVFRLELPALEKIRVYNEDPWPQGPRDGYAEEWPNLKKMIIDVRPPLRYHLHCLDGGLKLPKLEELKIIYFGEWKQMPLTIPRNLGISCGNVKTLTLFSCPGDNLFFLGLWEQLPLLEDVTLHDCRKLTNKGFVGDGVGGSGPAFLKLTKLKNLALLKLEAMPRVTDAVFKNVFRHLKLSSFRLGSYTAIKSISVGGIKELLTGPFAESIQKLDLNYLNLQNVSDDKLKEVGLCFRSSKML